ncbi:MAG: carboxypeptidase [Hyphomicrobiales bacterium]|nr:carboxypeptidase [Hyphomicrobiales bacterium]
MTHRASAWRLLLALLVAASATVSSAQERGPDRPRRPPQQAAEQRAPEARTPDQRAAEARPAPSGDGVLRLLPADAVTEHTLAINGRPLTYTATAGTLPLFDQNGERSAAIYYTAYVAKNDVAVSGRPITFAFNGGPGAASAFLTLGLVGPRITEFPANDPAAARLIDNPQTWLAFTDLVMIDPIGTGWSRSVKPDAAGAFYGVRADAQAMAKVVMLYLARNNRNGSPKYLLGESYGGFRSAKVAQVLQREHGISVSGIVMLSPLIEGGLIFGGRGYALGTALALPSLAAAELERKGAFTREAQAEAERFAFNEYLPALAGPRPTGEQARQFYTRVAEISGLPVEAVARSRGFIRDAFVKGLRGSEGKIVSRYDATFAVPDPFPEQSAPRGPDPLLDGLTRAYASTYSTHARDELGFKTDVTYILLASDISGKWDWESGGRSGASASDDIRELLALIPSFRLLVAHGYSDMVTPYSASRYVLDHLPDIGDPARTQLRVYRGGHMFYIDPASRKAFTADARAFYQPQ